MQQAAELPQHEEGAVAFRGSLLGDGVGVAVGALSEKCERIGLPAQEHPPRATLLRLDGSDSFIHHLALSSSSGGLLL